MTKMYKRLLAMVLAVLMALSMAACGGDSKAPAQETKTTPAASDAPAPSGEKQKIVIWNNNTNENQLKALEAQINPHFLYNTLECIRSEALLYECDSIARMAKALAAFFRYSISNKENIVTIRDELRNIENYFLIQSYRFENKFALEINVEDDREEVGNYLIPKLSLQPIVENAIFHGLETKAENGKVTIRIYTTDQELVVVISDNGTGIDWDTLVSMRQALEQTEEYRESGDDGSTHGETAGMDAHGTDRIEKRGNGIALSNVNQRIQLAFGNRYGLRLYSTTGIGTDVEIWLPKKVDRNDL